MGASSYARTAQQLVGAQTILDDRPVREAWRKALTARHLHHGMDELLE
jgi:hypothetical protein